MNKNNTYIFQLFSAYIDETLNKNQFKELQLWIKETPENKDIFSDYIQFYKKYRRITFAQSINKEKAWNTILNKVDTPLNINLEVKTSESKVKKLSFQYLKYAAIFVGIIGISYLAGIQFSSTDIQDRKLILSEEDIILKQDNGNLMVITNDGTEKVVNAKGEIIGTKNGNVLDYSAHKVSSEKIAYNELIVPLGKIFDLVLSDGTKVKLNAGTSLRFPAKFIKGTEREVFLDGEAYFDVKKGVGNPFIVNANEINVRVLGTQFNISSYIEDSQINTVLVEGSVSIYKKEEIYNEKTAFLLSPGYKAEWDKIDKNISINKADISMYVAWIEGKLIFRNMPFKMIRKKLERKYNVSIINNNLLLDENTFNAAFDIETIEEVMEILDRNFGIKYEIKENQIIIN